MKASATPSGTAFFNRILAKARGAEGPIAPRLPSLFEPVAGVERVATAESEEQGSPAAAHEHPNDRPASMAVRSPVLRGLQPLATPPLETTEAGDELAPGELDHGGVAAAPVATLQPLPGLAGLMAPAETVRSERRRNDDTAGFGVMRADQTELGRTLESAHEAAGINVPEEGHPASGVLIPKPAAVPVPYPSQREASATGSATARDLTSAPPTAEQPAPVINVTIGRVEVRAVQASAGKPRIEASRPKALSLDDYLKQRGGNR